jgi:adenylate cyclase
MSRLQHKQATVMSADVAGYSRMMAADGVSTLETLLISLEHICCLVARFGGRVIDTPGDNVLAEFPSENAALRCAIEIQHGLLLRNRARRDADRMLFRIGLHAGSLMAHEDRLYGDVVNVAARLQSAAQPGGILLSEAIAQRVDESDGRAFVDRGQREFKNIPYLVRTFDVAI